MEQMDLFEKLPAEQPLNGFYYETSTRKFVSFVQGRRHYEILASRCRAPKWPKDWQEKLKRERAI